MRVSRYDSSINGSFYTLITELSFYTCFEGQIGVILRSIENPRLLESVQPIFFMMFALLPKSSALMLLDI